MDRSAGNIATVSPTNPAARAPSRQVNSVFAAWTLSPVVWICAVARAGTVVSATRRTSKQRDVLIMDNLRTDGVDCRNRRDGFQAGKNRYADVPAGTNLARRGRSHRTLNGIQTS